MAKLGALGRALTRNNGIRGELADLEERIVRWSEGARTTRNKRRRKSLEAAIERARERGRALADQLRAADAALKGRLAEAVKSSESDARAFQEKFAAARTAYLKSVTSGRRKADDPSAVAPVLTARRVLRRMKGEPGALQEALRRIWAGGA